jgi:hypothetical protein
MPHKIQSGPRASPTRAAAMSGCCWRLIGAGDISAAQHLWESHSPKNLRGMLTGADGWTWDDQQQSYLSRTGRKVGNSDLKTIALMFALAIEHDLRIETSNMAVGLLTLDEWQRRMADTVKDLNVVRGRVRGGRLRFTESRIGQGHRRRAANAAGAFLLH